MITEVFNRCEMKCLLPEETFSRLGQELFPKLQKDIYGDSDGNYTISNLYFDTPEFEAYDQNVWHTPFRQKLRVRVYDNALPDSPAFVEIKKKFKGAGNKRRTQMRLSDAYAFLDVDGTRGGACSERLEAYENSNPQVLREIAFFKDHQKLVPRMIVSYDRQAYTGIDEPELRITFDRNIRARGSDLCLTHGNYGRLLMPANHLILMEIKSLYNVPLWLSHMLCRYGIRATKFSKYTKCIAAGLYLADKQQADDMIERSNSLEPVMINAKG